MIPAMSEAEKSAYGHVWDSGLLTDDPYTNARIWQAVTAALIGAGVIRDHENKSGWLSGGVDL